MWDEKVVLVRKQMFQYWLRDFWVCLGGGNDPLNFEMGKLWDFEKNARFVPSKQWPKKHFQVTKVV